MPKKYTLLFSYLLLLLPWGVKAQPANIEVHFPLQATDTVVLSHYFNSKIYANDTLILNSEGQGRFHFKEPLPQGIYSLYFGQNTFFDFLLGEEQQLSIRQNQGAIQLTGAEESQWFQNFRNYMAKQQTQSKRLRQRLQNAQGVDSIQTIQQQLYQLDEQVLSFWETEIARTQGSFYATFVRTNLPPPTPQVFPDSIRHNDSRKTAYSNYYRKAHYWDHFDLYDIRLWRTPIIEARLKEFFNEVLIQHPDSVLPSAIQLIEGSKAQPEVFQNLTSFILNNSAQSKYMSMENVFVALAQKYYLNGEAFWISDKTRANIAREVHFRKNNLLGNLAKELLLEDENGQYQSLLQQSTNYTVIVFWEPDCGHCKQQIPQLFNEVFLAADPSDLSVFAVFTGTDKRAWTDFLKQHELNGWLNVWDPQQTSNFRVNYNVRSTPMIYLLDANKTILGKQLTIEQLKAFFGANR